MADLSSLLEQSKKLLNLATRPGFAVHQTLEELSKESKKLVSKSTVEGISTVLDAKGKAILSETGFDAEKLTNTVNTIDLTRTFEPLEPLGETDIEGYLRHEHELIIISAIEEGQRDSIRQFEEKGNWAMENAWAKRKREIFEELGHQNKPISIEPQDKRALLKGTVPDPFASKSFLSGSKIEEPSLVVFPKMKNYATVVVELNNACLEEKDFPLARRFRKVAENFEKGKNLELLECWDIIDSMSQKIKGILPSAYHDPNSSAGSIKLRKGLIAGAKGFLERQYETYIQTVIQHNPLQAKLGERLESEDLIDAFLNIQLASKSVQLTNSAKIWALCYYLFRCGKADRVLKLAQEKYASHFQDFPSFVQALKAFLKAPAELLSPELSQQLLQEYGKEDDHYKKALYKILGRFELNTKLIAAIHKTTEDYLWFQLYLIREDVETTGSDSYTLQNLQEIISEKGPKHFPDFIKYVQYLLLTAQFERAIAHLNENKNLQVEAVHFALTLNVHNILRTSRPPPSESGLLHRNPKTGHLSLDLSKFLSNYVQQFSSTDPEAALHYYLCLLRSSRIIESSEQRDFSVEKICELILETRQYSYFLGEVDIDRKKPGYLEQYAPFFRKERSSPIQDLTLRAAELCRERNRLDDAIQLFHLAEHYENVVLILIKMLGDSIESAPVKDKALQIANFYRDRPEISSVVSASLQTCQVLIDISNFFSYARAGQIEAALALVQKTQILPLGEGASVDASIQKSSGLDQSIKRILEKILKTTADLLFQQYSKVEKSSLGDKAAPQKLHFIRSQIKNLVVFVGGCKLQMEKEIMSHLVLVESKMN